MARHRKSPRSRRYLIVFDPLTPPQGHQFDPKVKISVYPGLLLIPFNLICHMTMFIKLNFYPPAPPSPKPWAGFYTKLNVWGSLGLNFDYDGGPIIENGGPIFLYIYNNWKTRIITK